MFARHKHAIANNNLQIIFIDNFLYEPGCVQTAEITVTACCKLCFGNT
ncbi:hypothetical protein ECDEC12A_0692 [Escherichia coli DEC12A]|nr:hypothetical protein CV83906_0641 [Escherichia coli]EHX36015.1 hypothetical protein ECDEC12A_0692 [Escherichia coli DEC12A]EHX51340.1 hypothetical protein ECDEC12D_0618 [Escherichia coli DEC12D]ENF06938.1 hypothetical protein ECP03047775_0516 [Escherichia coli P0304777.5]KDW88266.1 hypothetical protein AC70_2459 [Escherichia coli 2-210-07_S4_C1]